MSIPPDKWNYLQDKYKGLMYKVATHVGLDSAVYSIPDVMQELQIILLEATETFKKNRLPLVIADPTNSLTEDKAKNYGYIYASAYHTYIKTSLWHRKDTIGKGISAKKEIRNNIPITTESESYLLRPKQLPKTLNESLEFLGLIESPNLKFDIENLGKKEKELVNLILVDPSIVRTNGSFTYKYISEKLKTTEPNIKIMLNIIRKQLQHGYH